MCMYIYIYILCVHIYIYIYIYITPLRSRVCLSRGPETPDSQPSGL